MLASTDVAPPRQESAKEPVAKDDGEEDAERAAEPARVSATTKPLIAVDRLPDVSSTARSRKAEIKRGHRGGARATEVSGRPAAALGRSRCRSRKARGAAAA